MTKRSPSSRRRSRRRGGRSRGRRTRHRQGPLGPRKSLAPAGSRPAASRRSRRGGSADDSQHVGYGRQKISRRGQVHLHEVEGPSARCARSGSTTPGTSYPPAEPGGGPVASSLGHPSTDDAILRQLMSSSNPRFSSWAPRTQTRGSCRHSRLPPPTPSTKRAPPRRTPCWQGKSPQRGVAGRAGCALRMGCRRLASGSSKVHDLPRSDKQACVKCEKACA